ncbi:uncharacterized protein LOC112451801, partial [Temnothorax curvispinosus]|uniref:Uncharacterized protein LOC112451801 n=1 Tax=Temnothorax curvispinosus TaxID=300111 RepID=A0A6J1PD46_9HYME
MKGPKIDNRSEEEKNEYYGPIDGVRPIDYREGTYQIFMRCMCLSTENNGEILYVERSDSRRRLCEECYDREFQPGNFEEVTGWHSICSPLHGIDIDTKVNCYFCNQELMWLRPSHQCRDCLEEYVRNRVDFEIMEFQRKNFEIK